MRTPPTSFLTVHHWFSYKMALIRGMTVEIPYWWCFITQIRVVHLIGWSKFPAQHTAELPFHRETSSGVFKCRLFSQAYLKNETKKTNKQTNMNVTYTAPSDGWDLPPENNDINFNYLKKKIFWLKYLYTSYFVPGKKNTALFFSPTINTIHKWSLVTKKQKLTKTNNYTHNLLLKMINYNKICYQS